MGCLPVTRIIIVSATCVFVAACTAAPILPPGIAPTIEQIAIRAAAYQQAANISPQDYLRLGMLLASNECLAYFDKLVQAQDRRLFASNEANLLGGIGVGAAAAAGAGAAPLAAIGLAAAAIQGTLSNAAIATGAGVFPDETARLILDKAMGAYVSALPVPQTIIEADVYVHGLAELCTSTRIHQLMRDAISSAQMRVAIVPPPTIATPLSSSPPQSLPGTIVDAPEPPKRKLSPKPRKLPTPPPAPPPRAYPPTLLTPLPLPPRVYVK